MSQSNTSLQFNQFICYNCGKIETKDSLHGNVEVREAIKPPYSPYRYKKVGYLCNTCENTVSSTIDKWSK